MGAMLATPSGLRVDTMAMGRGTTNCESRNWQSIGLFPAGSKVTERSGSIVPPRVGLVGQDTPRENGWARAVGLRARAANTSRPAKAST